MVCIIRRYVWVKKFKSSLSLWRLELCRHLLLFFSSLFFLVFSFPFSLILFSLKETFCVQLLPVSTEPISRPVYLRYLLLLVLVLVLRIPKGPCRYTRLGTRCLKLSRCLSVIPRSSININTFARGATSSFSCNGRFYIVGSCGIFW